MSKNHVWVIEVKDGATWIPLVRTHFWRTEARAVAKLRRQGGYEVRVRKYVRAA